MTPVSKQQRVRLAASVVALMVFVAAIWSFSAPSVTPIVLSYIAHTNNGYTGVILFEVTNQTSRDFRWSLYAREREWNHRVAVTELMEPDGRLRHIGSGGPLSLFAHESCRFATDELRPGETAYVRTEPLRPTRLQRWFKGVTWWLQEQRSLLQADERTRWETLL